MFVNTVCVESERAGMGMHYRQHAVWMLTSLLFLGLNCSGGRGERLYEESRYPPPDSLRHLLTATLTGTRTNAITRAVQLCSPAVVGITVTDEREVVYRDPFSSWFYDDPIFRFFFGEPREYRQRYTIRNLGSGFLISPDGYVVTNQHVVGERPTKITVTLVGGEHYDAELVGSDPVSDIALLKLRPSKPRQFPYLRLGNSDSVIVGEWIIALGNPFGLFDLNAKPTVTVGVVSNVGVNFRQGGRVYRGMIQTDAAISSGNSGGPLVNALGEVVGVNAAIISTAQNWQGAGSIGIGFAIPINRVKRIIERLHADGHIDRDVDIGIRLGDPEQFDVGKLSYGALVVSVRRGSPADNAGIEPGDIITAIDGTRIRDSDDANLLLADTMVGQRLRITILRDGRERTVELVVGRRRS